MLPVAQPPTLTAANPCSGEKSHIYGYGSTVELYLEVNDFIFLGLMPGQSNNSRDPYPYIFFCKDGWAGLILIGAMLAYSWSQPVCIH
jgi:hypothetical protein